MQELKETLSAEWIVCLDGADDSRLPEMTSYPDATVANRHKSGISIARNRCLASASGNMIAPVDADDIIVPHGLGVAEETIKHDQSIGWCSYASQDLNIGHEKSRVVGSSVDRRWDVSECRQYFINKSESGEDNWFDAFRANCVVYLADVLCSVGGWGGMPILEDLDLLFRVNRNHTGYQTSDVGILRRLHPSQTTKTDTYLDEKPVWTKHALYQQSNA